MGSDGSFSDADIPDHIFPLGDSVFVSCSLFRGKVVVHIRRYHHYNQTNYPSVEGVTLNPRWLQHIAEPPKSASDLETIAAFVPKNELLIDTTDFDKFRFIRLRSVNCRLPCCVVSSSIVITSAQWKCMWDQYELISTAVLNLIYNDVDFFAEYSALFGEPLDDSLPSSLDVSLGTQYLKDTLLKCVRECLMSEDVVRDTPEVSVRSFNSKALNLERTALIKQFYNSVWDEEPYLALKPAMYITRDFLKSVHLNDLIVNIRNDIM